MKTISQKKQDLYNKFDNSPLKVGEKVYLTDEICKKRYFSKSDIYEIIEVSDKIKIKLDGRHNKIEEIEKTDIKSRYDKYNVGANPFDTRYNNVRAIMFSLDSLIFQLELSEKRRKESYVINDIDIKEVNWNPYVIINGEVKYYQRGFVWSLEQKQLLVESIYKGIQCGSVLIRKRSWKHLEEQAKLGNTNIAFQDIVDGKQRLNAIQGFINDDFSDLSGNYFSDLSNYAQHKFTNNQLISYAEMDSNTTDEEVLYQFLKMNFEGVPQSKEHLEYVKSLI